MAGAVEPVVAEIVSEEDQHPGPPVPSDMKERELIDDSENAQHHGLGAQPDDHVADAHGERGSRVLELVEVASHHRIGDGLKHQQKDETWNGQVDQIGNLRHQEISVAQFLPLMTLINTDLHRSKKASDQFKSAARVGRGSGVLPQQLQFLRSRK